MYNYSFPKICLTLQPTNHTTNIYPSNQPHHKPLSLSPTKQPTTPQTSIPLSSQPTNHTTNLYSSLQPSTNLFSSLQPTTPTSQTQISIPLSNQPTTRLTSILLSNQPHHYSPPKIPSSTNHTPPQRAVGFHEYGGMHHDTITDVINKAVQKCDCLQSFFIIHSMGGGQFFLLFLYEMFIYILFYLYVFLDFL